MEDPLTETDVEISYHSETSTGEKRKREGKLRSKVWDHFTKVIKEDGTVEKCQCNHCHKLFSCSSRSGTTHLLRHVTDGICPSIKKEPRIYSLPWKFGQEPVSSNLENQLFKTIEDEYQIQSPMPMASSRGKIPQLKSRPKGGEAWMNEFRSCAAKLVELADGRISGSSSSDVNNGPDYSIAAAVKCLNEMEDIPETSEMYVDAFEILQDAGERECFICLPTEPRRRWLQRLLHRRHPLRYGSNM